jgi:unsaturated rhamnogalacturonyl hydrolase
MIIISLAGACLNQPTAGHNEHDLWSLRMAEAVMNRFDSLIHYNHPGKVKWQYDIAMLGQAIDKLGSVDERFSLYMQAFMDYFVREDGSIIGYRKNDYNLDHINPAKNLLTLYKRTGERKYLDAIQHVIRQLEEQPVTSAGGFWHKKRYPRQMWLDGVYMSSPFMAQCAKEFDQPQWFDTVARQITLIYEKTLDEESGLLYHAWDESKQQQWADPVSGCSPNFWGRAMGWYMMALVDVLDYFPQDHPSTRLQQRFYVSGILPRDCGTRSWIRAAGKAITWRHPVHPCSLMRLPREQRKAIFQTVSGRMPKLLLHPSCRNLSSLTEMVW